MRFPISTPSIEEVLANKKITLYQNRLTPWRYSCIVSKDAHKRDLGDLLYDINLDEQSFHFQFWNSEKKDFEHKRHEIQKPDNYEWRVLQENEYGTFDIMIVLYLVARNIESKEKSENQ